MEYKKDTFMILKIKDMERNIETEIHVEMHRPLLQPGTLCALCGQLIEPSYPVHLNVCERCGPAMAYIQLRILLPEN
jgi:predicted amidophosphoribosyltransferase